MYNSCRELFISKLSYIHSCCTAQCVACQKLPTLGDHFSFILLFSFVILLFPARMMFVTMYICVLGPWAVGNISFHTLHMWK